MAMVPHKAKNFCAPWHTECVVQRGASRKAARGARENSLATLAWEGSFLICRRNGFSYQPRECLMLVLTRKYQEKIRIGDNITITVLRTKGKAVRLGIEAPANVPVIRGELTFDRDSESETDNVATVSF